LVSALLAPASKPRLALDCARQQGALLVSYAVLCELSEVLHRKRFRRYIDEDDIRRFLWALTREAEWIDDDLSLTVCRDPKDDKFLSLAVSGQATHIITGDKDLLELHLFQGIQILSPSAFLLIRHERIA
jgi:putative PIN family toxin of toxin-antitoxin system